VKREKENPQKSINHELIGGGSVGGSSGGAGRRKVLKGRGNDKRGHSWPQVWKGSDRIDKPEEVGGKSGERISVRDRLRVRGDE